MGQSSNIVEKETMEMMNVVEVARMNECLKAMGMSDADILVVQTYIDTGVGLPTKEPTDTDEKSE